MQRTDGSRPRLHVQYDALSWRSVSGGRGHRHIVRIRVRDWRIRRAAGGPHFRSGSHVALLNADYRWPIARPQRGLGTWPLFLHTAHAAVFVDAGHTWDRTFNRRDLQSSVGAELSFDVTAGYAWPFSATIGAGLGRDGSRTVANRTTFYLRVGRAF